MMKLVSVFVVCLLAVLSVYAQDGGAGGCAPAEFCDWQAGGSCATSTGFSDDGLTCYCGDPTCRDRGAFCGQGLCEEWLGETSVTCPQDCGCGESASCRTDNDCRGGDCLAAQGVCDRTRTPCSDSVPCDVIKTPCMRDPSGESRCLEGGESCQTDEDCPEQSNVCLTQFCERTSMACSVSGDCPGIFTECIMQPGMEGFCRENGAVCRDDSECPVLPERCVSPGDKFCARSSQVCSDDADCPLIPTQCMLTSPDGGICFSNGQQCRDDRDCPVVADTCNLVGGMCSCGSVCSDVDSDGLSAEGGSCGPADACPVVAGRSLYQGCPVGDKNVVTLHTVLLGSKGTSSVPLAGAEVRVYDRNSPEFRAVAGSKNPDGSMYGVIFEADAGRVGSCVTGTDGVCFAGEAAVGDYLVVVKYADGETGKFVYVGRPKSPGDFTDTDGDGAVDLAVKDFQIIKVYRNGVFFEYRGGSKLVVTGSLLEVVVPESAVWAGESSVYPFIFTSDSEWAVDVCGKVPGGYRIVGVYDESGSLVPSAECIQVFVSGETKVVAFAVEDVGSPEPVFSATLSVAHKGKKTVKKVVASDVRMDTFRARVADAKALKAERARGSAFGRGLTGASVVGVAASPQFSVVMAFGAIACIIALVIVGIRRKE